MAKSKRSYPKHRYPLLINPPIPTHSAEDPLPLPQKAPLLSAPAEPPMIPPSTLEVQIAKWLASGARILFDMERGRALVYSFKRGFEELEEISVRMLSILIKRGWVSCTGQEGRLIHYAWTGQSLLATPTPSANH